MGVEDDVKSIAEEIMEYLHRRPLASDSLKGVTHWWLMQQEIQKKMELVEQALEQLVREGKVAKRRNRNHETIYSLEQTPPGKQA